MSPFGSETKIFRSLFLSYDVAVTQWLKSCYSCITKTCPCNVYTCTPLNHTLQCKTGVCRGIPIFLILLQNIDCGYSLEPPRRGGSNVYPQSMF